MAFVSSSLQKMKLIALSLASLSLAMKIPAGLAGIAALLKPIVPGECRIICIGTGPPTLFIDNEVYRFIIDNPYRMPEYGYGAQKTIPKGERLERVYYAASADCGE